MIKNDIFGINGGLCAAFYTLGCRVNQYETQAMEEQFRNAGYEIKSFDDECDVYVINTCTVTAESDRKSRQIIRRTAKVKKPTSVVVVCGCYSQGAPEDIVKIDGVDIILGNSGKTEICRLATEYLSEKRERLLVTDIFGAVSYEESKITSSDRTRAFVKIVDGCENHCTYCIIPSVRGRIRSRKKDDIINEIKGLVATGYKEFVLTGIETAAYGKDFDKGLSSPLVDIIRAVDLIEGVERIRLGSMEPTVFTEDFVKDISGIKKLMPHFHLSLQSGSDAILRLMKRKYNTDQFMSIIQRLRKYIPDVLFTTDVIVGFPGETEELYCQTRDFIKKCRFSYIHIFPYSKRNGTPASVMKMQLDKNTKKERVTDLNKVMTEIRREILKKYIGLTSSVLLETECGNIIDGYTPDYIKVKIPLEKTGSCKSGDIINVRITGMTVDDDGSDCLSASIE